MIMHVQVLYSNWYFDNKTEVGKQTAGTADEAIISSVIMGSFNPFKSSLNMHARYYKCIIITNLCRKQLQNDPFLLKIFDSF